MDENIKVTYIIYRLNNDSPVLTVAKNDEELESLIVAIADIDNYTLTSRTQLADDVVYLTYASQQETVYAC